MTWYGAHIISYVKFTDGQPQVRYPLWENIVLINAESDDAAFVEAERIGKLEYDSDDGLEWSGRPAVWVYGGIRRLVTCLDRSDRIKALATADSAASVGNSHGTEVTFLQLEIMNEQDFQKFMDNEPITLLFEE
jgi:hypothetical protein